MARDRRSVRTMICRSGGDELGGACSSSGNERQTMPRQTQKPGVSRAFEFGGGAEGDRTLDLCIANAALSQLSYRPVESLASEASSGGADSVRDAGSYRMVWIAPSKRPVATPRPAFNAAYREWPDSAPVSPSNGRRQSTAAEDNCRLAQGWEEDRRVSLSGFPPVAPSAHRAGSPGASLRGRAATGARGTAFRDGGVSRADLRAGRVRRRGR